MVSFNLNGKKLAFSRKMAVEIFEHDFKSSTNSLFNVISFDTIKLN